MTSPCVQDDRAPTAVSTCHSAPARRLDTAAGCTPLFTIQVPDGWTIEDNDSSIVLVAGERIGDRSPMPFLSIQYCSTWEPAEDSRLRACQDACSEAAIALPEEEEGLKLSALVKQLTDAGQVQFTRHAISPPDAAAFVALSCGRIGQVYLSLVSDEPRSDATRRFDEILASLRWKQSSQRVR